MRGGALLDDADRVYDHVRPGDLDRFGDRVECKSVDASDRPRRAIDLRELCACRPEGGRHVEITGEDLAELVAEHSRAAEDQEAQSLPLRWSGSRDQWI